MASNLSNSVKQATRPINVTVPKVTVPPVDVRPLVEVIRPLLIALDAMSRQNHEILMEIRALSGKPVKVDMPERPRRFHASFERNGDGEVVGAHVEARS